MHGTMNVKFSKQVVESDDSPSWVFPSFCPTVRTEKIGSHWMDVCKIFFVGDFYLNL